MSLFCYALLCVHSIYYSFAIILKRTRKLAALLLLSTRCIATINVMWLFLTVPWVGLQYVIVVFLRENKLIGLLYFCSLCVCVCVCGFVFVLVYLPHGSMVCDP